MEDIKTLQENLSNLVSDWPINTQYREYLMAKNQSSELDFLIDCILYSGIASIYYSRPIVADQNTAEVLRLAKHIPFLEKPKHIPLLAFNKDLVKISALLSAIIETFIVSESDSGIKRKIVDIPAEVKAPLLKLFEKGYYHQGILTQARCIVIKRVIESATEFIKVPGNSPTVSKQTNGIRISIRTPSLDNRLQSSNSLGEALNMQARIQTTNNNSRNAFHSVRVRSTSVSSTAIVNSRSEQFWTKLANIKQSSRAKIKSSLSSSASDTSSVSVASSASPSKG